MTDKDLEEAFFNLVDSSVNGLPKPNDPAGLTYNEIDDAGLTVKLAIACGESWVTRVIKTQDEFVIEIPAPIKSVLHIGNLKKLSNMEISQIIGHQYPNIGEQYSAERSSSH